MSFEVFTKKKVVRPEHIDELKHVNNTVYLTWAQGIAAEHWHARASREMIDKFRWVVLSHNIKYRGPTFLDDVLDLQTYVDGSDGAKSVRHVDFFKDGKLMVHCKTEWCLVQAGSMRPQRIPLEMRQIFQTHHETS